MKFPSIKLFNKLRASEHGVAHLALIAIVGVSAVTGGTGYVVYHKYAQDALKADAATADWREACNESGGGLNYVRQDASKTDPNKLTIYTFENADGEGCAVAANIPQGTPAVITLTATNKDGHELGKIGGRPVHDAPAPGKTFRYYAGPVYFKYEKGVYLRATKDKPKVELTLVLENNGKRPKKTTTVGSHDITAKKEGNSSSSTDWKSFCASKGRNATATGCGSCDSSHPVFHNNPDPHGYNWCTSGTGSTGSSDPCAGVPYTGQRHAMCLQDYANRGPSTITECQNKSTWTSNQAACKQICLASEPQYPSTYTETWGTTTWERGDIKASAYCSSYHAAYWDSDNGGRGISWSYHN